MQGMGVKVAVASFLQPATASIDRPQRRIHHRGSEPREARCAGMTELLGRLEVPALEAAPIK